MEEVLSENQVVDRARSDPQEKNSFLEREQKHILHLTARILKKSVSDSDDEYSIALIAVSEAIDSFDEGKGKFWSYASLVIRSRILDFYKGQRSAQEEILVSPETFGGDFDEDEPGTSISIHEEVQGKTAVFVDNNLRDEIEALTKELAGFGVDLFDLPRSAPKSEKTKVACRDIIKAFFAPPPLSDELKKTGNLPVKELLKRVPFGRKLIDRHRKYLLACAVVRAGDYSGIGEYVL